MSTSLLWIAALLAVVNAVQLILVIGCIRLLSERLTRLAIGLSQLTSWLLADIDDDDESDDTDANAGRRPKPNLH
jgi:hypothetical protein